MVNVACLIVGYNSARYLRALFDSLRQCTDVCDVYFIDNASSDNTVQLVSEYDFVRPTFLEKNIGFAAANNVLAQKALEAGSYKYLFCINPDLILEQGCIDALLEESTHGNAILQPLVKLAQCGEKTEIVNTKGNPLHMLGFSYAGGSGEDARNVLKDPYEIAVASGAALWIPSELFTVLGGFDESFFMYHEDTDLSWRARLLGASVRCVPSAVVYHDYVFSANPRKFYYVERNRLLMLAKNYGIKSLIVLLPLHVVTEIALLIFSVFTRQFLTKLRSYGGFLVLLKSTINTRATVQRTRVVTDRELMKYISADLQFGELKSIGLIPYNWIAKIYLRVARLFI